jgi:ribosome-binding protein aMBF1 (putative translation factor)
LETGGRIRFLPVNAPFPVLVYANTAESARWREAFPQYEDAELLGVCLRAARQRKGLTQVELSERTGIPQRHISEMENGKRPIGKKNARIFADLLGIGYKVFL